MKVKERVFRIEDLDCYIAIEIVNRQKDIFDYIDDYIENLSYDWFDGSDDSFQIVYKDGTEEYIDEEYDGHKIRRNNILSMVYNNACDSVVYGGFEINEYGVVSASDRVVIANHNITEVPGEG